MDTPPLQSSGGVVVRKTFKNSFSTDDELDEGDELEGDELDDELGRLGDDGELGGDLVVGGALGAAGGEDIPCVLPCPAGVHVASDGVVRRGDDAEVGPEPRR